jgi:catechol 2,3-dioxygenase-like lactoylglutathione lyase family enzyme
MDDLLQTTVNAEEGRRHSNANIDMKLEAIVIPVSDVDRAKEFYTRLGWRLDADHAGGNGFRLIQFTPPGSGTSIQFGVNLTPAAFGSSQGFTSICLVALKDCPHTVNWTHAEEVNTGSVNFLWKGANEASRPSRRTWRWRFAGKAARTALGRDSAAVHTV